MSREKLEVGDRSGSKPLAEKRIPMKCYRCNSPFMIEYSIDLSAYLCYKCGNLFHDWCDKKVGEGLKLGEYHYADFFKENPVK